jgi:sulfide:quinone oxidoreductase
MRWEHSLLPSGVDWIRSGVQQFLPNQSRLLLEDGQIVTYEFLVIATGIELRFDMVGISPICCIF